MNDEELNNSSSSPPSDSPPSTNPSSLSSPIFSRSLIPSEQAWPSDFPQGLTPPPDPVDILQDLLPQVGDIEGDFTHSVSFAHVSRQPPTPSSGSVTSEDLDPESKYPEPSLESFATEAIQGSGGDVEMTGGFQGDIRDGTLGSRKPGLEPVDSALDSSGGGRTTDQLDQWFDFDNAALGVPDQIIPPLSPFAGQAVLHAASPQQQRLPLGSMPGFSNGHFGQSLSGDCEPNGISNMGTNLHITGNRRKRSQDQIGFDESFPEMSDDGSVSHPIKSPLTTAVSSPVYYDANSPDDSRTGQRFSTPPNPTPLGQWDAQYNFNQSQQSRHIAGLPRVSQKRPTSAALQTRSCGIPSPQTPSHPALGVHFSMHLPSTLSVDQIPTKSRVETQIPVKLHLSPFPAGVTKLHLPRHTISKPKLYAKPPATKSPDMLELHANLVCSSAMRNPHWLKSALARARGEELQPIFRKELSQRMEATEGSSGDDSDESPRSENSGSEKSGPLNGGEVKICLGCMSRERKRAARKKVKKIKEEDEWRDDEAKRAVVFNNTEVREWMPISKSQYHGSIALGNLEGGMMVELHMRLACYCRHQGEKEGFRFVVLFIALDAVIPLKRSNNSFCRVIFTIKNHLDEVIAQQITSSILITDDHKSNSTMSTIPAGTQDIKILGAPQQGVFTTLHPNPNPFTANEQGFFGQSNSISQPPQYSGSLRFDSSFNRNGISMSPPPSGPLQQSPQFGPSPGVPYTKKRRINSVTKVPANLAMTKLENPTPFQSSGHSVPSQSQFFGAPYEMGNFGQGGPLTVQFQEPSTPSETNDSQRFSFDGAHIDFRSQIDQSQFTSPRSAYASAVTSPSPRNSFAPQQPQQPHQTRQIPSDIILRNPERDGSVTPEISRLIPGEGTTRGGIEVTVLGKGFVNGLTVLFGDTAASQNLCYSSSTLICMLPPRSTPGPVVVTLMNLPSQKAPGHYPLFTYVDDTEKSLMELALQIVGIKMHGTMATAQDIARSIIENRGPNFGQGSSQSSETGGGGGSQQHFVRRLAGEESLGGFGQIELEATLLKCLDAIDLDDSPHPARLNLRNKAGQTLLHLACILGMQRFVAALLARGASPNLRDKNGYTPMHFAALHNKPEIVKRLLLNKANAKIQTKNGETPQDLAFKMAHGRPDQTSSRRHSRTNSVSSEQRFGSQRSRASSSASINSLWDSYPGTNSAIHGRPKPMGVDDFYNTSDEAVSSDTDDADTSGVWMHSRRNSLHDLNAVTSAMANISTQDTIAIEVAQQVASGSDSAASRELAPSPSAMMAAWRENFAVSLQNFQNHWNLPAMPTAAEFHQNIIQNLNPMAKFNALMPPFAQPWSAANSNPNPTQQDMKDGDYKWWELFSTPQAPPPYEELFPHPGAPSGTAGDTVLLRGPDVDDTKVAEPTVAEATATSSSSNASPLDMNELQRRIAKSGRDITREQREEYRAHAAKIKRIENDRRLYLFWVSKTFFFVLP